MVVELNRKFKQFKIALIIICEEKNGVEESMSIFNGLVFNVFYIVVIDFFKARGYLKLTVIYIMNIIKPDNDLREESISAF